MAKEIHYVQFEGVHASYPMDFSLIKNLFSMYRKKNLVIKDWTITDFDYCLKGNPIIR